MTGMTISTKDISELRARTGAGIGDCKKALEEAGGDMAKAGELLRAKGIAKAEKRAGRSASQGLIGIEILGGGTSAGMIELDCETDFVARTEEFHAVLNGHDRRSWPGRRRWASPRWAPMAHSSTTAVRRARRWTRW